MTSTSVSDYRHACSELVHDAVRVPRMYYKSLSDLETMMGGHRFAFQQLGIINRDQSFNTSFRDWLYTTKGASGASGWAYSIENLIAANGDDIEALFAELVKEFLSQWGNETATNGLGSGRDI